MRSSGGYWLVDNPLVRSGIHKHTSYLDTPVSETHMRGVNVIQNTQWTLNHWVYDVLREMWTNGDQVKGIPPIDPEPAPARVPDGVWEAMPDDEKLQHKVKLAQQHAVRVSNVGKRERFLRILADADALRDYEWFTYPHSIDFRGRVYPISQTGLNPQGDNVARGILAFYEGHPLGESGMYWLMRKLANTYGMDKWEIENQLKWVLDHHEYIVDSVLNPLDGERMWMKAEDPLPFLATAREYTEASNLEAPEKFISHQPIPQDGSCNGIQHWSALLRDPIGALATNCEAVNERHDLYETVAEALKQMVADKVAQGDVRGLPWIDNIDRDTVKRSVMCVPYGLSSHGMANVLIDDGHTKELDGHQGKNALFLRDCIEETLANTVRAAREGMSYVQEVAHALAVRNHPFEWTSPSGMRCRMAYDRLTCSRIKSLFGRLRLYEADPSFGLELRKQATASPPQFIHSHDAAHMVLTCARLHDYYGVSDFAAIHDSLGVHACHASVMARELRTVFAEIYEIDWLERLEADALSVCPDLELPPRPAKGDYGVWRVLDAPYFFS